MYCEICGHKLIKKALEHEGMVDYCDYCHEYRFKKFNVAVSMIALSPNQDKVLFIQQYGRKDNILIAGYVNYGESLESALVREMKEEIGNNIKAYRMMKSEYYPPSNTLIINFAVLLDSEDLSDYCKWEVDKANWFMIDDALAFIKPNSLAKRFLTYFLSCYNYEKESFFTHYLK